MEAVILAGGKGTRLKPFTDETPKPLVPVGGKPIIEYLLGSLKKQGVTILHLAVNHMADKIKAELGGGEKYGLQITYHHEPEPLSTAAPIKLIANLPDNFLVVNSDVITDMNFNQLFDHHIKENALLTVACCDRKHPVDYGVLQTQDGQIVAFEEKPELAYRVSMGVYVFTKRVLEFIPDHTKFGFDDLMLTLLDKKEPVHCYPYRGYWLDVGRFEDYRRAQQEIDIIKKICE